jgi:hypothetical protein
MGAEIRHRVLPFLVAALTLGAGTAGPRGEPIFRAIALLERRPPGAPPRVRFEWSQRSGAVEYLLTGSWTARNSWTVQSREYRVTRVNATSWDDRLITFELSLPGGNHSWKLLPVRQPNGPGDPGAITQISFDFQ